MRHRSKLHVDVAVGVEGCRTLRFSSLRLTRRFGVGRLSQFPLRSATPRGRRHATEHTKRLCGAGRSPIGCKPIGLQAAKDRIVPAGRLRPPANFPSHALHDLSRLPAQTREAVIVAHTE